VITDPRLGFNHEFDWKNVQIFDKKRFLNKYLNSEMLHIQNNGLNLKTDRILVLFLCFLTRYVKTIMRFKIVIGWFSYLLSLLVYKFPTNENRLKWIEMDSDFQRYWFTNVKINAFQFWMHFYSFIGIAWSICLEYICLSLCLSI